MYECVTLKPWSGQSSTSPEEIKGNDTSVEINEPSAEVEQPNPLVQCRGGRAAQAACQGS